MVAMVWLGERSIGILLKKEYSKSPKCHFLRCLVRGSNQSNVIRFFNATCCCCGFFFRYKASAWLQAANWRAVSSI